MLLPLATRAEESESCEYVQTEDLLRKGDPASLLLWVRDHPVERGSPESLPIKAAAIEAQIELRQNQASAAQITELLADAQAQGHPACEARALWLQAMDEVQKGDLAHGQRLIDQALRTLGSGEKGGVLAARALRTRGNAFRWAGDYPAAIKAYEAALSIWDQRDDAWGRAGDQINLAIALDELGYTGRAIELSEQAYGSFQRLGNLSSQAAAAVNLGAMYYSLGQYTRAEEYIRIALAQHIKLGKKVSVAVDQLYLARILISDGRRDEGHPFLDAALAALESGENWRERWYALSTQANFAVVSGDGVAAKAAAEQCLLVADSHGDDHAKAACESALAKAAMQQGELDVALTHSRQALRLAEQLQELGLISSTSADIFWLLAKQGRKTEAIFFGKLSVNTLQILRTHLHGQPDALRQGLLQERRWAHTLLADLLIEGGRIGEAQQVLAMLKHQELYEYVRGDRVETSDHPVVYTGPEDGWMKRYREIVDQLRLNLGAQAGNAFLAFTAALPHAPTQSEGTRSHEKKPSDWQQRLSKAGDGVALLQYLSTPDHLRVVLTTAHSQRVYTLPITQEQLASGVSQLLQDIGDPGRDARPAAEQAWRQWLAPLDEDLRRLKIRSLWLSLDGPLRYVPFGALYDGRRWLTQRYDSVVLSEALGLPSPPRRKPAPRIAGFGASQPGQDFEALPYVPRELAAIVRSENGPDGALPGDIYLDAQFSRTALADSFAKPYPVVHIATHFRLMPGSDADSFLLLGDRSHLSVRDFRNSKDQLRGVELLTLSACQTALSASGVELEGLAAVAQLKGARGVMASLWSVSDAGTGILMHDFYKNLAANGLDKAEALATAQRSMLRRAFRDKNPTLQRLGHPYFWAPFVVLGGPS